MVASGRFRSLGIVIIIAIASSSECESVSIVEEASVNKFQKFIMRDIENSVSRDTIRYTPRCGFILATLVEQILERYTLENDVLCMITENAMKNDCFADAFGEFFKLNMRNVITMITAARNSESRQNIFQKPTTYLLLNIDLSLVLKPLMKFGSMGGTWNPRGLYISIADSEDEAVSIMTKLWENYVYKVIVLVFLDNTLETAKAYTWRPYYPRTNCGAPTKRNIIRLGKFNEALEFENETDLVPGTMPENFGNCPLNISYNIWIPFVFAESRHQGSGIEVQLIEMVCEKVGIRPNPDYHELTIEKSDSDAWAGSRIPLTSHVEDFELSVPYIQDSLCWFVPQHDKFYLFDLADEFYPSLWVPTALVTIIVAASLILSGKKNYWILLIWESLLEQADYKVPKKIRGIWASWLLLCLHLSVIYKTALVSQLTDASSKDEIKDQSDLLESGLKLSKLNHKLKNYFNEIRNGFLDEARLWFDEKDEIQKKILDRQIHCETVIKCYQEIPEGRALFTNKMLIDHLNAERSKLGSSAVKVRQLPTSLEYKITMIFAKGHAMLPRFNIFILFTIEAGFIDHWLKKIEETQARRNMHNMNLRKERRLSLNHLSSAFRLLALGLIISCVIFFLEIFLNLLLETKFYIHFQELAIKYWNNNHNGKK